MKDFDSDWSQRRARDARTFQICGEKFVMKVAVRPEVFDGYGSETEGEEKGAEQLDAIFLSMIELDEDAEARYRAIRARESDGLGIRDLQDVLDWQVEQQTGRPPTSQTASSPGRGRTGGRSTAVSPSRDLQAA